MRRPGYEPEDPDSLAVMRIKAELKSASAQTRSHVMLWLAKYYNDARDLYSPSLSDQQRQRVTINDTEYWLISAPKKR